MCEADNFVYEKMLGAFIEQPFIKLSVTTECAKLRFSEPWIVHKYHKLSYNDRFSPTN